MSGRWKRNAAVAAMAVLVCAAAALNWKYTGEQAAGAGGAEETGAPRSWGRPPWSAARRTAGRPTRRRSTPGTTTLPPPG